MMIHWAARRASFALGAVLAFGTLASTSHGAIVIFEMNNEFPGGAPRTPGYWKNWHRCTGGGPAANAAVLLAMLPAIMSLPASLICPQPSFR